MKQPIRAFSIGLFTAGIIMLGIFYFFGESITVTENPPVDDMIEVIEEDGYHVLSNDEYIAINVDDDEDGKKEGDDADQPETDDESNGKTGEGAGTGEEDNDGSDDEDTNDSDETATYTLDIEEGVSSASISSTLEENNIIDDAQSFNEYLHEEGYDESIQLGSFDVDSDMDFSEIADEITN